MRRTAPAIRKRWTTTLTAILTTTLLLPLAASADPPRSQRSKDRTAGYEKLIGPMGNATNVRPGFYRDTLGYRPPKDAPRHRRAPRVPRHLPPVVFVVEPNQPESPDKARDARRYTAPPREPLPAAPAPPATPAPAPATTVQAPPAPAAPGPPIPPRERAPKPTAPQPLRLQVQPADAEVWLNDDLLGAAQELVADRTLPPGVYYLDVEHPGHDDQRLFFAVLDEPVVLTVDLRLERDGDRRQRRARVR